VLNNDWAPTLVEYAGATPTRVMDGRSLVRLVAGVAEPAWRKSILVEFPPVGVTATTNLPYWMLRSKSPALTQDGKAVKVLVYAETLDPTSGALSDVEFYDLQADGLEDTSLNASTIARRVQQRNAMRDRLHQIEGCSGDTCRSLEN
jgi:arylsulfatase A-like enzyme